MPKMKTKRAAAKRLKATATGMLKRNRGWKRHKLEAKRPKRRRKLRKADPGRQGGPAAAQAARPVPLKAEGET